MAIISVRVPDKVARLVKPHSVVSFSELKEIEEEAGWVSYPVNLPAVEFLRQLRGIIDEK